MKKLFSGLLISVIVITLVSCGAKTVNVSVGEMATVESYDITVTKWEIDKSEYYDGAGFHLMTVYLTIMNQGNTKTDFANSYVGCLTRVKSGEYSYECSSDGGNTALESLQSSDIKLFFHIPNALYDSQDELALEITYHEGYKQGGSAVWKLR